MKTFVYVDHFKGEIQPASWEAIGLGKTLGSVSAALLGPGVTFKDAKQQVLDDFERLYLTELLNRNRGNITRSAHEAGLTRYHLRELLKRHNLATNLKDLG